MCYSSITETLTYASKHMKGAATQMLTDTAATTTDNDITIRNFTVKDDELPEFHDLKFEDINQLALDHPGANDGEYRKRRDYIASLAKRFRETGEITDVEYTDEEQGVWRHVAGKLEELQQKYASPFYLGAKKDLGFSNDRIPQLSEMNRRLKELTGFRLAPIEGAGRNTRISIVALLSSDAFDAIYPPPFAARIHA